MVEEMLSMKALCKGLYWLNTTVVKIMATDHLDAHNSETLTEIREVIHRMRRWVLVIHFTSLHAHAFRNADASIKTDASCETI